ncbi:hypothetical protein EYC80_010994 [Monilinia laxa]|uniref:Uncharacterized protein n=1 Tax=Monilinia laxa TaxID=61186 RepID=A0A5N6JSM8_MONLA|nr:hypothetical protein EYC80_010994 [Monilinia laxa]
MPHGSKATAGEKKGLPPSLDDERTTPQILSKLAVLDWESEREFEEENGYQKPPSRREGGSRKSPREHKRHQAPKYRYSPSAYKSEEPSYPEREDYRRFHVPHSYRDHPHSNQVLPRAPSPPISNSEFESSSSSSYTGKEITRKEQDQEELSMREMEERFQECMRLKGTEERLQMEMEDRLRERMRPKGTEERLQMEMEERLRERMRQK